MTVRTHLILQIESFILYTGRSSMNYMYIVYNKHNNLRIAFSSLTLRNQPIWNPSMTQYGFWWYQPWLRNYWQWMTGGRENIIFLWGCGKLHNLIHFVPVDASKPMLKWAAVIGYIGTLQKSMYEVRWEMYWGNWSEENGGIHDHNILYICMIFSKKKT